MQRQKHRRPRAAHNAPEVSHSTPFRSTRPGPHSRSHVHVSHSGSYPQVAAPSAAMAELYATPGPSASQCPASREKEPHFPLPSSGYGGGYPGSAIVSPPSSNSERHISHQFGTAHRFTHPSSSAHRSHSNKECPVVDYRRDSDHLHGERHSSTHNQPRLDSQAGTESDNREIFEANDYIRAWQGTLQPAISPNTLSPNALPPNALSTKGALPTRPPELASGLPQTRQ